MRLQVRALYFGCMAATLTMTGLTEQAWAESTNNEGPFVKLFGGFNAPLDSDFDGSNAQSFPSGEASLDGGGIVGMTAGYRFNRKLAVDLEYAYRSNDIDKIENSAGTTIADGDDLASVAIMANGYYSFGFTDIFSPYVGLGVGFLQEIDSDVELVGRSDQKNLEDQLFAWQAMIGTEVSLTENWLLYGEGRFMSAPSPELSNADGSYGIDYNNLSLMAGVGYQF